MTDRKTPRAGVATDSAFVIHSLWEVRTPLGDEVQSKVTVCSKFAAAQFEQASHGLRFLSSYFPDSFVDRRSCGHVSAPPTHLRALPM